MNNREKLLGGLVLAILVGLGARSVHTRISDAYTYYTVQETAKVAALQKAEDEIRIGKQAKRRLDQWSERSLPSDPSYAKLKYYDWLREELASSGARATVDERPKPTPTKDGSKLLAFTVDGEFTIKSLTDFLYAFYTAKHLHKISDFQVEPNETGDSLKLSMEVEAYSLFDADRADALAEGELDRLALDSLEEYRDSIVERNIFAVYTPPKSPDDDVVTSQSPPPDPPFDHAKHARATAIVEWNETPQVWILVETTGDRHRLFEGESFKIDDLSVKILKIDSGNRTVVYEADGEQYMVKLGKQNLREGQPVDPEKAS